MVIMDAFNPPYRTDLLDYSVGIDLGFVNLSICIVAYNPKNKSETIEIFKPKLKDEKMDIEEIIRILSIATPQDTFKALMEDVHSFPQQGVASTFKFGFSKGLISGIVKATNPKSELILVSPQKWKKYYGLIKKDKKDSIQKALGWLPVDKTDPMVIKMITKDHNNAEAFLMAKYLQSGAYAL